MLHIERINENSIIELQGAQRIHDSLKEKAEMVLQHEGKFKKDFDELIEQIKFGVSNLAEFRHIYITNDAG